MGLLTYKDTKIQSETVFKQFGESKWIPFAKENVKLARKDCEELKHAGLGKFLISCALGESLEEKIDIIKKHRSKVDVLTCDKGFGLLLDHGIKADYVMICDTNVEYKHLKAHVEQTKGVKLICTPYANIEWTSSWRGDRYFYINRDAIETELVFQDIFGKDLRMIPAGSNVSNAMVVFFMGCDENNKFNWSGYEMIYLLGYDYSWRANGNYYSWMNPHKRFYMAHRTLLDINKDWVLTSENLFFSAKWMTQYAQAYDIPIMNCSGRGILHIKRMGDLDQELSRIVGSEHSKESVKRAYQMLIDARTVYEKAKDNFSKTREGLIQWPSEMKRE